MGHPCPLFFGFPAVTALKFRAEESMFALLALLFSPMAFSAEPFTPDQACVTTICDLLGSFACNNASDIANVADMCRGNAGGACVQKACGYLGSFGCDEKMEVASVARACAYVYDTSCIDTLCEKLGSFGCDELSEITRVTRACR
jgi:hypothetical protein